MCKVCLFKCVCNGIGEQTPSSRNHLVFVCVHSPVYEHANHSLSLSLSLSLPLSLSLSLSLSPQILTNDPIDTGVEILQDH